MRLAIRTRILLIVGVVALSLWALYPPAQTIKLGLDLNGGVHLVLRVQTDTALEAETTLAAERLRERLSRADVSFTTVEVTAPTAFVVDGLQRGFPPDVLSAMSDAGFDPMVQPGRVAFHMRSQVAAQVREDTVRQARETIERRVDALGVAEAIVARYTEQDQIPVQLPGVHGVDQARQVIRSTSQLRLTLVEQGPFPSRAAALQRYGDTLPHTLDVLPARAELSASGESYYVVRRAAVVAGSDVRTARQSTDEHGRPAVAFTLQREAASRFAVFTGQHVGRALATVLDGRVMSVATIASRIDGDGQIAGLTRDEMLQQVVTLRSGALPADLEYVEERTIGASLGTASVHAGLTASLGGLALVSAFMVGFYRRAGLNALASVTLNLLILLAVMAAVPVSLTLPGIAGLILTIGMGVDSNVLIFERIREELEAGRTARAAVAAGFDRVWRTIVDTHVASLIAAACLFQFGTMPIRGFATTLAIGLLANVFTAVFVSRTLFLLLLRRLPSASTDQRLRWRLPDLMRTSRDYGRWRWHAALLSLVVMGAGAGAIATRGLPLGIDFSGGTLVVVEFAADEVTADAVRSAVAGLPGEQIVQRYGAATDRQFLVRLPLPDQTDTGDVLDAQARRVAQALEAAQLPAFDIVSRELVTASIGEDLQRRGLYATLASLVAITGYVAVRFRLSFAIGSIVATLHDILVTLSCLALAGYDLTLNVTAALLTITGYSVNDTIVVLDRVRENLRTSRAPLDQVVNLSLNQTMSRTIITTGTTSLAALALFLFGGPALHGFAFTILAGVASGTFSTVFIASWVAIVLSRRRSRAPAAASDVPVEKPESRGAHAS